MQNRRGNVDTPECGNCGWARFASWDQLDEKEQQAAAAILGPNALTPVDRTQRIYCRRCLHSRFEFEDRC